MAPAAARAKSCGAVLEPLARVALVYLDEPSIRPTSTRGRRRIKVVPLSPLCARPVRHAEAFEAVPAPPGGAT